jgi:hypothetical protein
LSPELLALLQIATPIVTGLVAFIILGLRSDVKEMKIALVGKMDKSDHEKSCYTTKEMLRESVRSWSERFDERQNISDSKFCGHSHTGVGPDARIIQK